MHLKVDMPLQRLIIVLPCYSLEDLPRNLTSDNADDYHQCWTSLWHPAFLERVPSLPEWKRSDSSSLDVSNSLVVVPAASADHIDTTLRERIDLNDNRIVLGQGSRAANVAAVAKELDVDPLFDELLSQAPSKSNQIGSDVSQSTPVSVQTFYALGFVYQQLHILTRKVHYSTNLDLILFQEQVSKAAAAFNAGDLLEAEKWIQSCFDQLSQERDRYFSQQANLIDLTLIASTTLGESLNRQLQYSHSMNILAPASLLRKLVAKSRSTFESLSARIQDRSCTIIGGYDDEPPTPWLTMTSMLRCLTRGRTAYQDLGLESPQVFARLTGGTQANDAQLLRMSGVQQAIVAAFLDGELPRSDQAKIRWQSADNSTIDAIASFVVEADSTLSVLSIAVELAKQFDYHQVPTLVLTHWPNRYCEAFHDLLLAVERTAALGKWQRLDKYFESTGQAYSNTALPVSQFKYDLPNTFAEYGEFNRKLRQADSWALTFNAISGILQLTHQLAIWMNKSVVRQELSRDLDSNRQMVEGIDRLLMQMLNAYRSPLAIQAIGEPESVDIEKFLIELTESLDRIARSLIGLVSGKSSAEIQDCSPRGITKLSSIAGLVMPGTAKFVYIMNPCSVPIRYFLRTGDCRLSCDDETRVYADESSASTKRLLQSGLLGRHDGKQIGGNEIVVDIPATGIVQLKKHSGASLGSIVSRRSNLASSPVTFGNEYLDVQLDQKTGFIRAMLVNRKRGSRMSGQLSILDPAKLLGIELNDESSRYAVAQDVKITLEHNSTTSAIVTSRGKLVFDKSPLADFEILYEIWRGSRLLQITPKLSWLVERKHDSIWAGAPVWRSAWPSEGASLTAWHRNFPTKVATATFFTNQVIEVDDAEHKLYLMMQGANLHRRRELRYLDTHLGSGDDVSMLVGLDVPHPIQQWASWLSGPMVFGSVDAMTGGQQMASFASTNTRGLQIDFIDAMTYFSPERIDGEALGFPYDAYFLVQETLNRSSTSSLQFFRDVKMASKVNSHGQTDEQLEIVDGIIQLKLRGCETAWIGVNWL